MPCCQGASGRTGWFSPCPVFHATNLLTQERDTQRALPEEAGQIGLAPARHGNPYSATSAARRGHMAVIAVASSRRLLRRSAHRAGQLSGGPVVDHLARTGGPAKQLALRTDVVDADGRTAHVTDGNGDLTTALLDAFIAVHGRTFRPRTLPMRGWGAGIGHPPSPTSSLSRQTSSGAARSSPEDASQTRSDHRSPRPVRRAGSPLASAELPNQVRLAKPHMRAKTNCTPDSPRASHHPTVDGNKGLALPAPGRPRHVTDRVRPDRSTSHTEGVRRGS